jgi:hypothetical protein
MSEAPTPERWTEEHQCGSCTDTCHRWDDEGKTCYGKVNVTDAGSSGEFLWVHFCDNPKHDPDYRAPRPP